MTDFLHDIGVKGRLLLAFFAISAIGVLGAAVALFAFAEAASVLDRMARQRIPESFAALELSRQAERIGAAASLVLADTTLQQQMRTDLRLRKELADLERLFAEVKSAQPVREPVSEIEGAVATIRQSLAQLQVLVAIYPERTRDPRHPLDADTLGQIEKLLRKNSEASAGLTVAVDRFVQDERAEIAKATADVAATQRRSTGVLLGMVALSLISSGLIVWLYVGRNIIRRLTALSTSMLAVAGGRIDAPLPADRRRDEIGRMADALVIFRDTAIEKERVGRLKRFLAPQVAELIISSGDESVLDSHRRDVAVLFCDLRGFTSFAETAAPEEIMALLRDYHASLGQLVHKFAGTLERFTGDGLIVLFNDPLPCPDPCVAAAHLAVEMRAAVSELARRWRQLGSRLGFGVGITYGFATLGRVGFEGRFDYTAIGSVVNLAARLCERARSDEILIDNKVRAAIEGPFETEAIGDFTPKGFSRSIEVFNIVQRRDGGGPRLTERHSDPLLNR